MLIQKSAEFNIELNAKHRLFGKTAFQLACENGHFIKLLIFASVDNYTNNYQQNFNQSLFTLPRKL